MQLATLLAAALALALAFPAAAADLRPGKYRTVSKMEGSDEKPETDEECVTQKDIDAGLTQLGAQQKNPSCKVSDFKRGGGRISYRTTCQEGGVSYVSDVAGTFSGDSFDMRLNIRINKDAPMKLHMVGKRIGACTEE